MKKFAGLIMAVGIAMFASPVMAIEFGEDDFGNVDIHGYISQGYLLSDENNFFATTDDGSAEFNEFAVNFGADLSDKLHVGMQIFARNLGEFGNGEPEIDWGYGDYRWQDWMGFRAGKMKLMHGLYNTSRDIDFLRTFIFLPQSVYNEAWRDTVSAISGAEVYGDVYMGSAGSLAYQFQGGETEFPVDGGVVTTTADQSRLAGLVYEPETTDTKHSFSGGFAWSTPVEGLRFSLTGWLVEFDMEGTVEDSGGTQVRVNTLSKAYTGSVEYQNGPFTFAAEYMGNRYEFKTHAFDGPGADKINAIASDTVDLETEGYYASVAYRFNDWFELGAYYSEYYADKDDKDGDENEVPGSPREKAGYNDYDAWLKDTCITTRFDITDNWVFKLEGHMMNGAAILMKDINTGDDGKLDTEEDWYLLAAKVTFSF